MKTWCSPSHHDSHMGPLEPLPFFRMMSWLGVDQSISQGGAWLCMSALTCGVQVTEVWCSGHPSRKNLSSDKDFNPAVASRDSGQHSGQSNAPWGSPQPVPEHRRSSGASSAQHGAPEMGTLYSRAPDWDGQDFVQICVIVQCSPCPVLLSSLLCLTDITHQ